MSSEEGQTTANKSQKLISEQEEQEEGGIYRFGNLPDDVLRHVYSFLDIKSAFRTSVLAKRWRFLWTCVGNLDFDSDSFREITSFKNFVHTVLERWPPESKIARLSFSMQQAADTSLTNRVLDYPTSHDVDQLIIKPENRTFVTCPRLFSPGSSFGFTRLTTLQLERCDVGFSSVHDSTFCLDILASSPNLINLCLINCCFVLFGVLKISSSQLLALTLKDVRCSELKISAPKVKYFDYRGDAAAVAEINLPSLLHAEVEVSETSQKEEIKLYPSLFKLLQGLYNAQFVTLHSLVIRALSNASDMLVHQPFPFDCRLKSLKFKIDPQRHLAYVPKKVKTYLLSGSPSAEAVL